MKIAPALVTLGSLCTIGAFGFSVADRFWRYGLDPGPNLLEASDDKPISAPYRSNAAAEIARLLRCNDKLEVLSAKTTKVQNKDTSHGFQAFQIAASVRVLEPEVGPVWSLFVVGKGPNAQEDAQEKLQVVFNNRLNQEGLTCS